MKLKNNKIFINKPRKKSEIKKKLFFLKNNIWQIKIERLNKKQTKLLQN
jgi:hypothetical protein